MGGMREKLVTIEKLREWRQLVKCEGWGEIGWMEKCHREKLLVTVEKHSGKISEGKNGS